MEYAQFLHNKKVQNFVVQFNILFEVNLGRRTSAFVAEYSLLKMAHPMTAIWI
jgi:hypothetical protein